MKLISDVLNFVKGITVYALVGGSGTGKSYRAKLIAQKHGLEAIIDDGLLIRDDKILAGHSAKKEKTYPWHYSAGAAGRSAAILQ